MKKKLPLPDGHRVSTIRRFMAVALGLISLVAYAQPTLLKDVNEFEDLTVSEFRSLTVGANKVYFVNNFNELWKTTGNPQGTVRLKKFKQIGLLACIGETLYFTADDGSGMELWKSGGTFASTVKVKEFIDGPQGGNPHEITNGDGAFYFVATTPDHGAENRGSRVIISLK